MHTVILDDLGLVASLKHMCMEFSEHYPQIALGFEDSGKARSIPRELAYCFHRVAQEGLHNIAKHSRAECVSVDLDFEERAVVLTIKDDGAGFVPNGVKRPSGLGLISMEERARSVNGKLTIESQPGLGTQISLEVPLPVENL
jgi:signal transduction histidine kinase